MTGNQKSGTDITEEHDRNPAAPGSDAHPTGSGAATVFAGLGELRALCRAFDWAVTPLGPVAGWSQSLRTTAAYALASGFPTLVLWGSEFTGL